jgi:hypothetical protein
VFLKRSLAFHRINALFFLAFSVCLYAVGAAIAAKLQIVPSDRRKGFIDQANFTQTALISSSSRN